MKKSILITIGTLALLSSLVLMWYTYESKDIRLSVANFKKKDTNYRNAHIDFTTNMGTNYHARLEIAVPCKNKKQYSEVTKKASQIKNALITTIEQEEFAMLIATRDFDAIKKTYISVINRFTDKPIDTIYIDSFNY